MGVPVPIIDQVDMLWDGTVQVVARDPHGGREWWPFLDYVIVDGDPTRLEAAE